MDEYSKFTQNFCPTVHNTASPTELQNKKQTTSDIDEDFKYALRLSEALNGPSTSVNNVRYSSLIANLEPPLVKKSTEQHTVEEPTIVDEVIEKNNSVVKMNNTSQIVEKLQVSSLYDSKNKHVRVKTNSNSRIDTTMSVVDPSWETIDPNPDIYALFLTFNNRFFWGKLDMVEVKWSSRMTLCAGLCTYQKRAGHCVVKLSKPLLTYRPRKDLVETLLHEMIHAYLFVTNNNRDRNDHGPRFHQHMYRINRDSGANVTVYHSFHNEVRMYKTHVWKCDGPCQYRSPYYGLVKRSMNRAPSPNDLWWAEHAATCGGKYHKIQEPENYGKKKKNITKENNGQKQPKKSNITEFFTRVTDSSDTTKSLVNSLTRIETKLPSSSSTNDVCSGTTLKNENNSPRKSKSLVDYFVVSPSNPSKSMDNPVKRTHFGNSKVVTLADLSNNSSERNSTKFSSNGTKKWIPLPGQKNIFSFVHKS